LIINSRNLKLLTVKIILVLIYTGFSHQSFSQNNFLNKFFKDFIFTTSLNYISSATIQLNPNNSDLVERNSTTDVKGGYGYGFTLKKRIIGDDIYLGISTEYIKITDDQETDVVENAIDVQTVHVSESLEVIPVEMSLYFNIPRFADNLNVYLGGGFGFYFGSRTRKMVGLETSTISKDPMFSLNVLFGAEYMLDNHFAMNFEIKVRDGTYAVHSRFPTDRVRLNDQVYYFQQDLNSRIYVDGMKVSLGIGYFF